MATQPQQQAGRASAGGTARGRPTNVLELAGVVVEGASVVDISGLGPQLDKKGGDGRSGEKVTIKGFKVPRVRIEVQMWKRSQLEELAGRLRQHVRPLSTSGPSTTKDPAPITIGHWKCDLWGIASIIIEGIDGPKLAPSQMYSLTIDASEYRPPAARAYGIGVGQVSTKANGFLADQEAQIRAINDRLQAIQDGKRLADRQQYQATAGSLAGGPPSVLGDLGP